MKLTREERYALTDIAIAPEGVTLCMDEVSCFEKLGLVKTVESADGNYVVLTPAGRQALKGKE